MVEKERQKMLNENPTVSDGMERGKLIALQINTIKNRKISNFGKKETHKNLSEEYIMINNLSIQNISI